MVTRRAATLSILFLMLIPSALAVTVNPQSQQLTNPKDQVYSYVFTVMNNDPQPRTLSIKLDEFSTYLQDQVTFSKQQFTLLPGQAENLQLSIQPHGLGPETHTLKVGVYDAGQQVASFELLITVSGTPVEDYKITATAKDTVVGTAVPVSVELGNYGNIIGYAKLVLTIEESGSAVGSVEYPSLIQVLPGAKLPYDLVYTDTLKPGFYTAVITAVYPSKNVTAQSQFSVRLEEERQRINQGSDLVLTFASLGNPPAVTYSLADDNGKELLAGTFLPQTGDIVIPTSTLAAGSYMLTLKLASGDQRIIIDISSQQQYGKLAVLAAVIIIILVAGYSYRRDISLRIKLYKLRRGVEQRQALVINLINRSHRLVDEYSLYARSREAGRSARAPDKGS